MRIKVMFDCTQCKKPGNFGLGLKCGNKHFVCRSCVSSLKNDKCDAICPIAGCKMIIKASGINDDLSALQSDLELKETAQKLELEEKKVEELAAQTKIQKPGPSITPIPTDFNPPPESTAALEWMKYKKSEPAKRRLARRVKDAGQQAGEAARKKTAEEQKRKAEADLLQRQYGGLPKPIVVDIYGNPVSQNPTSQPVVPKPASVSVIHEVSEAMDELLRMTGLETVKASLVKMFQQADLREEQKLSLKEAAANYNAVFTGNPGTGKTTVSSIYARALTDMCILPEDAVVFQTSGADLANIGVDGLKKELAKIKQAKGGVIFIDEAYQLNPEAKGEGAKVLDFLLPIVERLEGEYGRLVVILAGYKRHMEKLFEHNEGLDSRFPNKFNFADFENSELMSVFDGMVKPKFTIHDQLDARILIRRIARARDTQGFGNARAVRNAFQLALQRQAARLQRQRANGEDPDIMCLEREDLLGPKVTRELLDSSKALTELNAMVGLQTVKNSLDTLLQLVLSNAEREEMETPIQHVQLNRVFLGNPGTGKTTVAKLYAEVLRDLGLLTKGDCILKNASDFVGSVIGEAAKTTRSILEQAKGSVLVIDEAYNLSPEGGKSSSFSNPYKTDVIDTLVEQVQGVPGDDRVVIMLGYKEPMENMFRTANPGLARRFQLSSAFTFADYEPQELRAILLSKCKKTGLRVPEDAIQTALEILKREKQKPNFGNGGAVANLLSEAQMFRQERLQAELTPRDVALDNTLTSADFEAASRRGTGGADEKDIFAGLVGMDSVIVQVRAIKAKLLLAKKIGSVAPVDTTFLFVGAPGTGKTTMARRMGRVFEELGILSSSEVVETSASDFGAGFVGQSGSKTKALLRSALGKVLFIDEAYRLNPAASGNAFMQDVVDELVGSLTLDEFKGKMVVILGGYEHDIDEMLKVNQGLRSRFAQKIVFSDFSPSDACKLLSLNLRNNKLELSDDLQQDINRCESGVVFPLLARLIAAPDWGNGRDVDTLARDVFGQVALRFEQGDPRSSVLLQDVCDSVHLMITKKSKNSNPRPRSHSKMVLPQSFQTENCAAPAASVSSKTVARLVSPEEKHKPATKVVIDEDLPKEGEELKGWEGNLTTEQLDAFNAIADELGLSSADPDESLRTLSARMRAHPRVVAEVAARFAVDEREAHRMLSDLDSALGRLEDLKQDVAMKAKLQMLVPIWRCAVCGSYSCSFRPFIERYVKIDVPS